MNQNLKPTPPNSQDSGESPSRKGRQRPPVKMALSEEDLELKKQKQAEYRKRSYLKNRASILKKKRAKYWNPETRPKIVADKRRSRLKHIEAQRERVRNEDRFKKNARKYVYRAIKSGKMKRGPCCVCGAEKTQAHHDDYSKPLEVRWLCGFHHGIEHQTQI